LFVVIIVLCTTSSVFAGRSYQDLRKTARKYQPALFSKTEYLFDQQGFLYVNFAPEHFRACLDYADKKFNNNQRIDCMDEAWEAAARFLRNNTEDKEEFANLMDVLARGGFSLSFGNCFKYFDCGLLLPKERFDHEMEEDADHDEYMQKRTELTNKILKLDSDIRDFYAELESYNELGKEVSAKLNVKKRENTLLAFVISREKYRGAHQPDPDQMDSLSDKSFNRYSAYTIEEYLDMGLLDELFDYIIKGRDLMRKGLFLDYRTMQLKDYDAELDEIGLDLVDFDVVRMDDDFPGGAVAGYDVNDDYKEMMRRKLENDGIIGDSALSVYESAENIDQKAIRELNRKIYEIFKLRKATNEEIQIINNDIICYNNRANEYLNHGDELYTRIVVNNKKIERLKSIEEQLKYEKALIEEEDMSLEKFMRQFELRKKIWAYYINIIKTKQKSWDYYMKSVDHHEKGVELSGVDARLEERIEKVRDKQELLEELHEELLEKRSEIDEKINR
jgi:hypothetical protein